MEVDTANNLGFTTNLVTGFTGVENFGHRLVAEKDSVPAVLPVHPAGVEAEFDLAKLHKSKH